MPTLRTKHPPPTLGKTHSKTQTGGHPKCPAEKERGRGKIMDLERWTEWAERVGLKTITISQYSNYLIKLPENPTQEDINQLVSKHNNHGSRLALKNLQCHYNMTKQTYTWTIPPYRGKMYKPTVKTISNQELNNILLNLTRPKQRIVFLIMYHTGLRVNEVLNTRRDNINLNPKEPNIRGIGKGNKEFSQPINTFLLSSIKDYLENDNKYHPLPFKMSRSWFWRCIHKAVIQGGITDKKISPHWLRHTFGHNLMEDNYSIEEIRSLMRHENISTTSLYLRRADVDVKKKFLSREFEKAKLVYASQ